MNDYMLYIAVFVGAALPMLEVWIAVPLGVLAGLPWLPAALVGFAGNLVTIIPVIYAGDRVRSWIARARRRKATDAENDHASHGSRKSAILTRFGVPGLAFLGPFLIGVHAAAAFAIASGANRVHVTLWFAAAILICALSFALMAEAGVTNFLDGRSLPFVQEPAAK